MSKREKIQEYVLILKWKLIALEKKGHFDPDLDTSVLELVDELPKQYKMKAKSLTKWILTNADKTLYFDKNILLHINGQTGGSPYRLCQICNITAQNQKRNLLFKTIL